MKIALCMIVKHDEAELLESCLKSIAGHVDGIFLYINHPKDVAPTDAAVDVARKFKAKWTMNEWTNFGDARNKNFTMVSNKYDFILWLDTDDTVENPDKLHQVALATPDSVSGVYMPYDYQHDQFGNVTVQHYVARLVRNNGTFAWSNKILHESLEPVRQTGKAMNNEVHVIHHADDDRRDASLHRNIEMLEKELEGEGDHPDARTLYYLGSTLIDVGHIEKARELLGKYLQTSGWAEERAQAWVYLGNTYFDESDNEEARECYIRALSENPKDPTPCVELAKLDMVNQMWDKAIEWLQMALAKKPEPMSTTIFSTETRYRAYMYLSDCYMSQGGKNIEKALKYAQKALEMRPDDATRSYYERLEKLGSHIEMTKGVVLALKELEESEQKANIVPFIQNLPSSLQDNPAVLRFQKRHLEPKVWPDKSIVIFCGNSAVGEWGPWSLAEGIGGSEEAVVRLGNQLAKKGWKVTVYGNPGIKSGWYRASDNQKIEMAASFGKYTAETREGQNDIIEKDRYVEWRNYWELNLADKFDVFIGWRMPWFFDIKMSARKKYLWLHDVMEKEEFTKERLDNLDKVIVLSKYHRSLFPMIPNDKIFLSANGIDPFDFEETDGKFERNPHTVIYQSSHVRGLQLLYEVWPNVLKKVPDAQLRIMYGWGSYDAVNRGNPERMAWKETMIKKLATLKNAVDLGKVSQEQIIEEILGAGVWAYPCPFPEIYAITAVKNQAGGAWPVSSDFAALAETVRFGEKIHMNEIKPNTPIGDWNNAEVQEYEDRLIHTLLNPPTEKQRQEMMETVRNEMSWKKVAEQWTGEME